MKFDPFYKFQLLNRINNKTWEIFNGVLHVSFNIIKVWDGSAASSIDTNLNCFFKFVLLFVVF